MQATSSCSQSRMISERGMIIDHHGCRGRLDVFCRQSSTFQQTLWLANFSFFLASGCEKLYDRHWCSDDYESQKGSEHVHNHNVRLSHLLESMGFAEVAGVFFLDFCSQLLVVWGGFWSRFASLWLSRHCVGVNRFSILLYD